MSDTERCVALYRSLYGAMIDKDVSALDAALDEDFVLIHMTGMRQDKPAFIQSVANDTLNYYSCRDDGIDVEICGDSARLVGRSRVEAAVFGGGRHRWRLQQEMSLVKRDGGWRVALSKASTY